MKLSENKEIEKVLLKDVLFNKTKVGKIAGEINRVYPAFKKNEFVYDVLVKFPELELKARIMWISECLKKYLPLNYERAVKILIKALPVANNPELSDDDFGDFIYAPYAEYVAKNGCTKKYLQISLGALYEITQRFSAEDAIRFFINTFSKETLNELLKWSKDSHYHVRRLSSEGTRPKLPWSKKIIIPLTAPLPILDNLFSDKTRFVTRSVANHINDISKIDRDLAIKTLSRWQKSGKQKPKEMSYVIRHALRTLIKQGNKDALELIGITSTPCVSIRNFVVPKIVKMNTLLEFSFNIEVREDAEMIIDYILSFQNKSGKLKSKKVFKLKRLLLTNGQSVIISKKHLLRQFMTTRKLYAGKHEIEIQINGKSFGKKTFMLI